MSKEAEKMIQNGIYNECLRKGVIKEDLDILLELNFRERVNAKIDEYSKALATKFFYHWWNAKGNNTEQGFDNWWKHNKFYFEQLLKQ